LIHGAGGGVGDALCSSASSPACRCTALASKSSTRRSPPRARCRSTTRRGLRRAHPRAHRRRRRRGVRRRRAGKQWARFVRRAPRRRRVVGYGFSSATRKNRRSLPHAISNYLGMPRFQPLRLMDDTRAVMGF
jgi:hypothetical protein